MRRKGLLWMLWGMTAVGLAAYLGLAMTRGEDRTSFMPGPITPGHRQIALACDSCHTEPFGGGDALQKACVKCHGQDRQKPIDSHPRTKFTDPRNADRLGDIDALACVTCHTEHRPEITGKMGLTQPSDLCFYCHSDVAKERPSHEGMAFDTCRNSGCHNFHDNRALYTDFLIKHLNEPAVRDKPAVPRRELASVLDQIEGYPSDHYPVRPLSESDADAPAAKLKDRAMVRNWAETGHAHSGVNCSACHVLQGTAGRRWEDRPDHRACAQCHDPEAQGFMRGKHGIRLKQGLAPMTPAKALLPMKADVHDRAMSCNTCHGAHRFDTRRAATEACLGCHDDEHSRYYESSPHAELWKKELAGKLPPGAGVSCATCHMPRVDFDASDWLRRILVEHNQNATLTPNSKMVRPACLHCHGLGFSLDALADADLVRRNFKGKPSVHLESLAMAEREHERRLKKLKEKGLKNP